MDPLNLNDLDDAIFDFILNDPQLQATQLSFEEGQSNAVSLSPVCGPSLSLVPVPVVSPSKVPKLVKNNFLLQMNEWATIGGISVNGVAFVPLGSDIPGEIGQNSKEWFDCLLDFVSGLYYSNTANDFALFYKTFCQGMTYQSAAIQFLNYKHDQVNVDGTPRYRATTIRSMLSVLCNFFSFCLGVSDLKKSVPQLESNVGKWEKLQQAVKKARTFEREDLSQLFGLVNTPDILEKKVNFSCM
jgi:hypothetical protein